MPTYEYRAKDGPGRTVSGELEADSQTAAVARVDALGYIPVWVREKQLEAGAASPVRRFLRIRYRDVTVLTRQFASLIRSGVPILRALSTAADQTENRRLRAVVDEVKRSVRDGSTFSHALSRHPRLFDDLYVNMIRSGESAGVLDTVLTRLAEAREREEEFRRKVQAAVAYPALVLSVGAATVFVLLAFFLPRVVELFQEYESLPWPTRALMAVSGFFSSAWYWLAVILLLLAAVFRRMLALESGRMFIDRARLRIPVLGPLLCKAEIARFARTLSLLLESYLPVDRALDLSARSLRNIVLRDEVERARRNTVQQGLPLSAGLKRSEHFPVFVANLVAVGEEAGRLEESLAEVASFYEREVDQLTRIAVSLLEPVLILAVGAIVGFIVAAMLLPVFELGTGL